MVELRTGLLRAHRPGEYMTKITAVGPGGECPLWHKFLDRITCGDKELYPDSLRIRIYCLPTDPEAILLPG